MMDRKLIAVGLLITALSVLPSLKAENRKNAGEVKIGWAKAEITPTGPTYLGGQMYRRLATRVHDPLLTSAMAIESGKEKIIMISVDATNIKPRLLNPIRRKVSAATGVPETNIIASATHTHCAPKYEPYKENDDAEIRKKHPDYVAAEEYFNFLIDKLSGAAIQAWNARKPGKIAYGMGEAAVGECRRIVLKGRGGLLYSDESDPDFLFVEGHVDHSLNIMATYSMDGKLTGLVINLACPAQVKEVMLYVSADFWHYVRTAVAERYGKDVVILPQCSPAGDQAPHKILNRKADTRMMLLRKQLKKPVTGWTHSERVRNEDYVDARCREIARRIMTSVNEVLPLIEPTATAQPVVKRRFQLLQLPPRLITEAEYKAALGFIRDLEAAMKKDPENASSYQGRINWHRRVVNRYENKPKPIPMELHVVRIGGAVFCTNTFELYLDFGDRIKGGSKAEQTFAVQLAGGSGYLASARSGMTGYGSAPASCPVSSEAGDLIVRESVKNINALFE